MSTTIVIFGCIALTVLLALSAFFSGSETALMAVSRIRLRHLSSVHPERTRTVEGLLKQPDRLIGTILLGNNLVNVGMSAIATAIAISLLGDSGIIYVTVVLTLLILIFAEITPKVYSKYHNEKVAFFSAPILNILMNILRPLVVAVTFVSSKVLLLFGLDTSRQKRMLITEDEVKTCIELGWEDDSITANERALLSRVFTLNDKTVGDIMVPKAEMKVLNTEWKMETILKTVINTGYSRFPAVKGKSPEIIGLLYAKDILKNNSRKKPASVEKIVRPVIFIDHEKKIDIQLRSFQRRKVHQAVVLDEKQKVIGLLTLEDIIEELVGSIEDEHDFD